MLELAGMPYDTTVPTRRDASRDTTKRSTYPRQETYQQLSTTTVRQLCHFLQVDYYLFAYQPPSVCRQQINAVMETITNI